jgi:DNA-binding transcriptional MerR regulator
MGAGRLFIGKVAAQSGLSRRALRLYEAAGILPRAARTPAGYRVYPTETLALLGFVAQARRLGFTLGEIRDVVAIRRDGAMP